MSLVTPALSLAETQIAVSSAYMFVLQCCKHLGKSFDHVDSKKEGSKDGALWNTRSDYEWVWHRSVNAGHLGSVIKVGAKPVYSNSRKSVMF